MSDCPHGWQIDPSWVLFLNANQIWLPTTSQYNQIFPTSSSNESDMEYRRWNSNQFPERVHDGVFYWITLRWIRFQGKWFSISTKGPVIKSKLCPQPPCPQEPDGVNGLSLTKCLRLCFNNPFTFSAQTEVSFGQVLNSIWIMKTNLAIAFAPNKPEVLRFIQVLFIFILTMESRDSYEIKRPWENHLTSFVHCSFCYAKNQRQKHTQLNYDASHEKWSVILFVILEHGLSC